MKKPVPPSSPLLLLKNDEDQGFLLPSQRPVLDLNQIHFVHRVRDLDVIGTWLALGERMHPALCLLRANRRKNEAVIPCLVALPTAWIWADAPIGDYVQAYTTASEDFAEPLGFHGSNRKHVHQIMDTIKGRLGDLIGMPPLPLKHTIIAEVTMNTDQGTIERTIRDSHA